ncbi:MAG: hypothetical protein Q7J73_04190, partial [Dehalococcoidales bacterium]|nr:hypothetical protein [Dehalococcoidales bacterium]
GKLGLGTTSPFGQFAIEVSAVAGSNTPVFFIGDSGTSSPFLVANVNGRIGIATNTVDQYGVLGIGLSVATNTYISGGLSVGRSATTSSGGFEAGIADVTYLQVRNLVSCTGDIETDADGVLHCGTDTGGSVAGNNFDIQFNDAGTQAGLSSLTFDKSTGLLAVSGDVSISGSDLNIGNGITATSTISGEYGKLGFGSTSPWGQVSIDVDRTVVGSNTPVFVISDAGSGASGTPFFTVAHNGNVGIATSVPTASLTLASSTSFLQVPGQARVHNGADVFAAANELYISGKHAYVVTASNGDVDKREFLIYDISNPASTTLAAEIEMGAVEVFGISVSGRYAYLTTSEDPDKNEFRIFDVGNVASSTEVGGIDLGIDGNIVTVIGRYAYIGTAGDADKNEFVIYDISNVASTTELGGIATVTNAPVNDITIQGRYAYIAQNGSTSDPEIRVIDISDPSAPYGLGGDSSATSNGRSLAVSGKYAYIGESTAAAGLRVYDISNPSSLVLVSTTALGGSTGVVDLALAGKYLYVLIDNFSSLFTGDVLTYDISDPTGPVLLGATQLGMGGGLADATMGIFVAGRYVYVTKGSNGITNDFVILDPSGIEAVAGSIQSLDAGILHVWNDANIQGRLGVVGGASFGESGILSQGAIVVTGTTTVSGYIAALFGGNVGIGTSTPGAALGVGGSGVFKGNLNIAATSTAGSFIATSTLSVGTSTPNSLVQFAVSGNSYFSGGLSVGRTATTSSGGLMAGVVDFQYAQIRNLISCDTIDADADGVLRCGTDASGAAASAGNDFDIQFNDAGTTAGLSSLTFNKSTGLLLSGGDISLLGSDLNFSNGVSGAATATFSGQYGKLGLGTTSPYAQFAIDPSAVSGSTTPIFVIGDSGSSSPIVSVNWGGVVGIGTSTPAGAEDLNGFGLAVATNTLISGNISVTSTATSTFNGGIYVKENGGITSASGLIVSAGRVGIGLATPERLVEILGTGESASLLRVRNNTDGINAVLDIHNDG